MSYLLEIELKGLPPMNSAKVMHWTKRMKLKNYWRDYVYLNCYKKAPSEPLKKARVTIIRYSSMPGDFDNLAAGCKFLLDGLKFARIITDDNMSVIGQPVIEWKKASPKKGKVFIKVESLE